MFLSFFLASPWEDCMAFLKHGAQDYFISYYFPFCICAPIFLGPKVDSQFVLNILSVPSVKCGGHRSEIRIWIGLASAFGFLFKFPGAEESLVYCGTCWDWCVTVMTIVRDSNAHWNNIKLEECVEADLTKSCQWSTEPVAPFNQNKYYFAID